MILFSGRLHSKSRKNKNSKEESRTKGGKVNISKSYKMENYENNFSKAKGMCLDSLRPKEESKIILTS